jgi:hypothetical protein
MTCATWAGMIITITDYLESRVRVATVIIDTNRMLPCLAALSPWAKPCRVGRPQNYYRMAPFISAGYWADSTTKQVTLSAVHAVFHSLRDHLKASPRKLPDSAPAQLQTGLIKAYTKLANYHSHWLLRPPIRPSCLHLACQVVAGNHYHLPNPRFLWLARLSRHISRLIAIMVFIMWPVFNCLMLSSNLSSLGLQGEVQLINIHIIFPARYKTLDVFEKISHVCLCLQ